MPADVRMRVYHSGEEPHPAGLTLEGSGILEDDTFIEIFNYIAPGEHHGPWSYDELKVYEGKVVRIKDDNTLEEIK